LSRGGVTSLARAAGATLAGLLVLLAAACDGAAATAPALWFGGDVHLGEAPRASLAAVRAMVGEVPGVVNLEGPVMAGPGGSRVAGEGAWLGNPSTTPAWLAAEGVIAASVANNHAGDEGGSVAGTAAALRSAGVAPVGGEAGAARLRVGGAEVTVLAYEIPVGEGVIDERLASALEADLGDAPGTRVVAFHTSGVPSYLPAPPLEGAVDRAVGLGADIVVVHGSHRLGAVERRGRSVIAWGLGNLAFDCPCTRETEAAVLRVELAPGRSATLFPVRAGLDGASPGPAPDPGGILDLVGALGGTPMARRPGAGSF
jgi:hypothetical protein